MLHRRLPVSAGAQYLVDKIPRVPGLAPHPCQLATDGSYAERTGQETREEAAFPGGRGFFSYIGSQNTPSGRFFQAAMMLLTWAGGGRCSPLPRAGLRVCQAGPVSPYIPGPSTEMQNRPGFQAGRRGTAPPAPRLLEQSRVGRSQATTRR